MRKLFADMGIQLGAILLAVLTGAASIAIVTHLMPAPLW